MSLNEHHPFMTRLSQIMKVNASDRSALEKVIDGEQFIKRRRDVVAEGYEYRKLCFVKEGYALRYKLLRSGKRQILNVILPGDMVGFPVSFLDRSIYSVIAFSDLTISSCSLAAFISLCLQRPQFALALNWLSVQEATTYAEHIIDIGRRKPVERLAHFLLEIHSRLLAIGRAQANKFELPFSQEVIGDLLGLSVPHVNRMMQQLRAEKLIAGRERNVEFADVAALGSLAQYQPLNLTPISVPAIKGSIVLESAAAIEPPSKH